ncbi:PKD domain protein [compost metagenome]
METKLTTITPSYRSFVPDQILTAEQLNEFLNYFDDQDRLSRIFLSGVGIVCGFNIGFNSNSNGELVISQGGGVTTDGDFLKLSKADALDPALENIDIQELRFTHYRSFDDSNAKYKPFFWKNINGSDVQINLWEAIPADQVIPSDQTIISRTDLQNLVVLLYLENYPEDPSACTGIDCENQGIKNIRKLRVLIVSQSDAEYILSNDSIFNANYLISTYLNLEEVAVQRVTVNATNSASFASLRSYYLSAIQSENTIEKLKNGFTSMLNKLGMNNEAAFISNGLAQLFGVGANYPQMYFQYRYDLLCDITNTYNELKEIFMDSICSCNPSIRSFPKHLMLGRLVPVKEDQYLKKYRHDFYKSPILKDEKNWCERFKLYVNRVMEMLNSYNTNITQGEIRITPSSYRSLIENKAIPFYYGTQNFSRLLDTWNYDKYKVHKQSRNLSYHISQLDPSGQIQFPLRYDLEPHNFLRIEGIQGFPYQTAMQQIDNLKNQYGLAFDVKALGITINPNDPINMEDYACHFEDLQIMLDAWTQEHECLLGKVSKYYSAFSTIDPTQNYLVEEYIYPTVSSTSLLAAGLSLSSSNNVVKENLYTENPSLGVIMLPVFDQFQGCSGNDIAIQVNRQIDRFDYGTEMKDIVEATLKGPNEVLSHAYVLMDKRPMTLADVLPSVVQSVNASTTNLCGAARKTFSRATKANLQRDTLTMLLNLAQDTTALCCSAEKLELIYDEIERRKKDILIGLSLAKFQEQHPGMEHLAGTHQGGTFILVYVRNAVNGIFANTVVADFTLPYLCCSDCRPVGFIMSEVIADLRLSSNQICLKSKETASIDVYRYPADGTVELDPKISGITIIGDQLKIVQTKLPETAYGQVIHFKVNGTQTDAELIIYKATEASIIAPPNPLTSLTVTFDCGLPVANPVGYTYFWDFGDGTTATDKSPTHTYPAPMSTAIVRLTVTSGTGDMCPVTLERTLEFDVNNNWPPDPVVCKLESQAYIGAQKAQYEQILSEMGIGGAGSPTASTGFQGTIDDFNKFYSDLTDDIHAYLAGDYNTTVGSNVQSIANGLFNEIILAHAEGISPTQFVRLYHNLMRSGISVVRCQEENVFIQAPIISMISTFTDQMNPGITPSLPSMNIPSGTPDNFNFLNEVLNQRQKGSTSFNAVTALLTVVVWKPQA